MVIANAESKPPVHQYKRGVPVVIAVVLRSPEFAFVHFQLLMGQAWIAMSTDAKVTVDALYPALTVSLVPES